MLTERAACRFIVCCLGIVVTCCTAIHAAEGADEQKIDPQARKVIDAFGKYYAGLDAFGFTASVTLTIEQNGQIQSNQFVQAFRAQRPNKFAYTLESPQAAAQLACDGNELSVYMKGTHKYAVQKAPETWSALLQNPFVMGLLGFGNANAVTSAILADNPAAKLIDKNAALDYAGLVMLDGAQCHLIKASGAEMDWQLWIDAGDKPLVRQFVPDLGKALARLAKANQGTAKFDSMKVTNTVTYKDWQVNPKLPDETFAFNVPEGATKVKTLLEIVGGAAPDAGPHPLLGKPAPEVKLALLDGGKLDLASLKDKNIVILDFWATWCGPCAQAMPVIEKVAKRYQDKGVLLFAVNVQEEADDIRKFLDETELQVAVALDKDGAVSRRYQAAAIPQTVLVGKDGSVQVVRIGASPDLEEALAKDLDALAAGKNLAAEAIAAAKERTKDAQSEKGAASDPAADGARKKASASKLRAIGLAMLNYESAYKHFPPAVGLGPDKKTPHSWRVELLPFLEKKDVYDRYKMNEPWDSEHNLSLVKEAADVFSLPGEESADDCAYFLLTGPATAFDGQKTTRIRNITDGTSLTIGLVEAKRSIPWTKPKDIRYDAKGPLPELGGFFDDGFHVVFLDCSVLFLSKDSDEQTLRAMITHNGREPVKRDPQTGQPSLEKQ